MWTLPPDQRKGVLKRSSALSIPGKTCEMAYTEDILCAYNKGDHIEMP